jgi:alpha-L-fucosidase
MTVDKDSWGNRRNIEFSEILTPVEILSLLVSTVSCGGNILINVGPTKEGTIIPIFEERLRQMGTWLKTNGEAIYATTHWVHQNDSLATDTPVWYTAGKGDLVDNVYALVIGWPADNILTLGSVMGASSIEFLGLDGSTLSFTETEAGLQITFPALNVVWSECGNGCQWVYALKITKAVPSLAVQYSVEIDFI